MNAQWFRRGGHIRGTRLVMVGASVGGFLLLGLSAFTSWPVSGGGALGSSTRPTVNPAYESEASDCLNWTKSDLSDVKKVDCGNQHLFEVTGKVDLTATYPKDAKYPTADEWAKISLDQCTKPSLDYLTGRYDPFGKYTVGPLNPGTQEWAAGFRTLRCGLQVVGPAGGLLPSFGTAKKQDQSDVYDPGVCLGLNGKSVGDPVDCAQPHTFEIIGVVDLGAAIQGADFPPPEKQDEVLPATCDAMAAEYAGGVDLKGKGLVVTWDNRAPESWAAGSKRVNCKIGAIPADASGLTAFSGSVRNPDAPPLTTSNPPQTTAVSQAEATGAPLHSEEGSASGKPSATSQKPGESSSSNPSSSPPKTS
ncbi:putative regulator of septum formation [Umezawaea tangerina]|uniref:Putative regulator of septum formation n=2 Tax=Umezawaea tangerina TaxID=84725 RepID=A0A2T0TJY0_9PSEU|nr:putative regulator of septum formation [Umezawaea tangerina]